MMTLTVSLYLHGDSVVLKPNKIGDYCLKPSPIGDGCLKMEGGMRGL